MFLGAEGRIDVVADYIDTMGFYRVIKSTQCWTTSTLCSRRTIVVGFMGFTSGDSKLFCTLFKEGCYLGSHVIILYPCSVITDSGYNKNLLFSYILI